MRAAIVMALETAGRREDFSAAAGVGCLPAPGPGDCAAPRNSGPLCDGTVASYLAGKMKSETHLTSKGQVVIPKAVRDRLNWRTGMRLDVETLEDGAVVLRPETTVAQDIDELIDQVSGFLGRVKGDPLRDLEADHRAEIETDERWLRHRR
jgi:AbrB family looped-hinge helix DNA binding protein